MKVVFVTHYSALYGANRSLLNLIDGFKKYNVEPFVICPSKGDMTIELEKRNIPFFVLSFKTWMGPTSIISRVKSPARLIINMAILPVLIKQVKKWNADIIYTNSSVTPIGALIAIILKKPHIWHIREFGELDYQLQYDWGRRYFEKLLDKAEAIIAISKAIKENVLNNIHSKIYVVYNGVISEADCNNLKEKAFTYNISSNYTFAIVGILNPNKGQEQAIRALALLKKDYTNVRLIIVGAGSDEYLEYLKKLCFDLEVEDNVEFLGYISNPFEVYLKADAILMCSKFEAMGRVTAEAMAVARPVIGYNNGGTAEIIEDEVTGLLYNGDYRDLAKCMARFVENPKWAKKLGINGWKKAREEFTVEVYAKQVYEVVQEVMNKKKL